MSPVDSEIQFHSTFPYCVLFKEYFMVVTWFFFMVSPFWTQLEPIMLCFCLKFSSLVPARSLWPWGHNLALSLSLSLNVINSKMHGHVPPRCYCSAPIAPHFHGDCLVTLGPTGYREHERSWITCKVSWAPPSETHRHRAPQRSLHADSCSKPAGPRLAGRGLPQAQSTEPADRGSRPAMGPKQSLVLLSAPVLQVRAKKTSLRVAVQVWNGQILRMDETGDG